MQLLQPVCNGKMSFHLYSHFLIKIFQRGGSRVTPMREIVLEPDRQLLGMLLPYYPITVFTLYVCPLGIEIKGFSKNFYLFSFS
jgi:hypothetical protein